MYRNWKLVIDIRNWKMAVGKLEIVIEIGCREIRK